MKNNNFVSYRILFLLILFSFHRLHIIFFYLPFLFSLSPFLLPILLIIFLILLHVIYSIAIIYCFARHSCAFRIWMGYEGCTFWTETRICDLGNRTLRLVVILIRKVSWCNMNREERARRGRSESAQICACMWKKKIEMIVISLPVLMTRDSACFRLCTLVQSVKFMFSVSALRTVYHLLMHGTWASEYPSSFITDYALWPIPIQDYFWNCECFNICWVSWTVVRPTERRHNGEQRRYTFVKDSNPRQQRSSRLIALPLAVSTKQIPFFL